jgi:GTP-binding protein Era
MSENTVAPLALPKEGFRSGYVAIVGWPNVGKSTLMNALLQAKLSIVSSKPQTTREAIRGILTTIDYQIVFVDTPGWLQPNDPFQTHMKTEIVRALRDDADVVLWLVELQGLKEGERELGLLLSKLEIPVFAVISKIDAPLTSGSMQALKDTLQSQYSFIPERIFTVSAERRMGLNELIMGVKNQLPVSPPYFPDGQITDRWERTYVAELIQEQIFRKFREEVPHASCVMIEDFEEKPGKKDVIQATIIVETEGQKGILVGKGGTMIRELGTEARMEIERLLGRPVFLSLTVKIHKNWRKDSQFLKQLGAHPG